MNCFRAIIPVFLVFCFGTLRAEIVIEVSPDGKLRTIEQAQIIVRKLRQEEPSEPIRVVVGSGTYLISEPLLFGPEDGGMAESSVIYEAAPNARPVISGGKTIGKFTAQADGI